MTWRHVILAFVSGCATTVLASWITVGLRAQTPAGSTSNVIHVCAAPGGTLRVTPPDAPCPAGQQSLFLRKAPGAPAAQPASAAPRPAASDARITSLEQRIRTLEEQASRARLAPRVTAPLEVIDRNGRRVFYVGEDHILRLYNTAGKDVVRLEATDEGGFLLTTNATGTLAASIGAVGSQANLKILEAGNLRTELGSPADGSGLYRVVFMSKDGNKLVARLGAATNGSGNALVADADGNIRAGLATGKDFLGTCFVQNTGGIPVAQVTEGSTAGGLLLITSADGTRMVDAGTADGIGLVRTGPGSFMMAAGIGLPGSFIMGKAK